MLIYFFHNVFVKGILASFLRQKKCTGDYILQQRTFEKQRYAEGPACETYFFDQRCKIVPVQLLLTFSNFCFNSGSLAESLRAVSL